MSISNRAHETVRDDSVPAPTAPKSGNSAGMAGGAPARIALRPAEAATTLGISRRKLAELMADRSLGFPRVKLGGVVVIPVDDLREWLRTKHVNE